MFKFTRPYDIFPGKLQHLKRQISHPLKTVFLTFIFVLSVSGISQETDSLLQALRDTDRPSEKIPILNRLAQDFINQDPVRAENYATQALFIAESIGDEKGQANANFSLGVLAHEANDTSKANEFFIRAEKGFLATGDELGLANLYLQKSSIYKYKRQYEQAINFLYTAKETFQELEEKEKLAETYNQLGGIFYDQENVEKAFEYYTNSLDLYVELNDTRGTGSLFNNIGEIYRLKNEYDRAIEYYKKSLAIYFNINDPLILALIYTNLGTTYLLKEMPDSAHHYLVRGIEFADLADDPDRISSVRIAMGKYYKKTGDRKRAIENLEIGYEMAAERSNFANITAASKVLSSLYEESGDYEKAYNYYRQNREKDDKLNRRKNLEKITQMEMKLMYDLENEIRQMEVQRTNLRYFALAISLLSLILIGILLYGRQRIRIRQSIVHARNLQMEQEQLEEEIDFKNRELTTNVMYLVKKNELINHITEKIMKAKNNFKPGIRKAVDDILLELQSNIDENIWKTFEERFGEVHRDFYDKLMTRFPNLTENDRKLCALIKLDMNTKEIAAIIHQNPNSIEVARTRLRKKLEISKTDVSLHTFLAQL